METISVIIPVYNAEQYLDRCIDSVLKQSYQNLEVLLIDDGSTDKSGVLCDQWAEKDDRIRVIHKTHGGISKTRNVGLISATGTYLAFVDADDYLDFYMYEVLIKELALSGAQIVVCNWLIHNLDNETVQKSEIGPAKEYNADEFRDTIAKDDFLAGGGFLWNKVINYAALKSKWSGHVLFHDSLSYYEDKIWLVTISSLIQKVKVIDYCGYHYSFYDGSLSHNRSVNKLSNIIRAYDVLEDEYKHQIGNVSLPAALQKQYDIKRRDIIWYLYRNHQQTLAAYHYKTHRHLFGLEYCLTSYRNLAKRLLLEMNLFLKKAKTVGQPAAKNGELF